MSDKNTPRCSRAADFTRINLEYFLAARDLYRENPHSAIALLGASRDFLASLEGFTPGQLANLRLVKVPLLAPRFEPHWWQRMARALQDDQRDEIEALSEQAGYYLVGNRRSGE